MTSFTPHPVKRAKSLTKEKYEIEHRSKKQKVVWSPKEKELISKYRKGLIWKTL
jgi:hypothetical protein